MSQITIPISGMHCASCARLIERRLLKTPGVSAASVNYASEQALVEYSAPASLEVFTQAIESTGYKVGAVDKLMELK